MKKKIVITHGVGKDHEICKDIETFRRRLADATAAEVEVFFWNSPRHLIPDPRRFPGFGWIRGFMHEAIRDFAHVARNKKAILKDMPDADFYFGHSGGSVLVSSTGKPCVMTGAPAQLVRDVEIRASNVPILNIMHWLDPIAAMYEGAKNVVLKRPAVIPVLIPVRAHTSYWTSRDVVRMTAEWFFARKSGGV